MAEDYITPKELEAALAEERKNAAAEAEKKNLTSAADVKAAIDAYDKDKDKEDKAERVKDWDHWVATELNSIKSEFTVFKMEWVPILATLPALFSVEELLMQKYNLEYRNGFLQTQGMIQRGEERALRRAETQAHAENERRNTEAAAAAARNQPPADGTQPPGTQPPGTRPPGGGTRPPGTTPGGGQPPRNQPSTTPPRNQPPARQPGGPAPRRPPANPAPQVTPVAPQAAGALRNAAQAADGVTNAANRAAGAVGN
ncbi:hypothetical protein ACIPPS_05345 [Streptomyces sp. NPDC090127]|uniref:hypothetical protein n=1 Tax=Streptomyces sp. NPDC090127 TaxID=3365953 RepID=UPI00380FC6ED